MIPYLPEFVLIAFVLIADLIEFASIVELARVFFVYCITWFSRLYSPDCAINGMCITCTVVDCTSDCMPVYCINIFILAWLNNCVYVWCRCNREFCIYCTADYICIDSIIVCKCLIAMWIVSALGAQLFIDCSSDCAFIIKLNTFAWIALQIARAPWCMRVDCTSDCMYIDGTSNVSALGLTWWYLHWLLTKRMNINCIVESFSVDCIGACLFSLICAFGDCTSILYACWFHKSMHLQLLHNCCINTHLSALASIAELSASALASTTILQWH